MARKYRVAGIMSGTSLDGLDIAVCEFKLNNFKWEYKIIDAETITYTPIMKEKLATAHLLSTLSFLQLDVEFGKFIGKSVKNFLDRKSLTVEAIASHGHTVFHQPNSGITVQIGNGANIVAESGISTICNFRNLDVALHGQGAPLVPLGDELLFNDFDYCLNLGGFANVSYSKYKKRIAFDICPVNIVMNYYAKKIGLEFDKDGNVGKTGKIDKNLLEQLNQLGFYKAKAPKSLGREWLEKEMLPIIESYNLPVEDIMRTLYEHIANQIVKVFPPRMEKQILVTGGGAFNSFLINLMQSKTKNKFIVPDKLTVEYKEALIFAFLGVLRLREEKNCLSTVTGAKRDSIAGAIYLA
jgi:anhydro-N-acetylmuramic acid kinase